MQVKVLGLKKTPTKRRKSPEHVEQVKFVKWFRGKFPDVVIFAIPNGAHLSKGPTHWNRLKAEGALPGMPDLMIPEWRTVVEMKRPGGGKLSEDQSKMLFYFEAIGWDALVCHGAEEAKVFCENYIRRMPMGKP